MTLRSLFNAILDFDFSIVLIGIGVIAAFLLGARFVYWLSDQVIAFLKIGFPELFEEQRREKARAAIEAVKTIFRSIKRIIVILLIASIVAVFAVQLYEMFLKS